MLLALGSPAFAKTKVTVALWVFSDKMDLFRAIEAEFEKQNPDVDLEYVTPDVYTYFDKLIAMIAGGVTPDVVWAEQRWVTPLVNSGAVQPIESFVARSRVNLDMYFPNAVEAYKRDGHLYGLPFNITNMVYSYNADHFDQAGLNRPPDSIGQTARWTWAEFRNTLQKLTRVDAEGNPVQVGLALDTNWTWLHIAPFQAGADLLDESGRPAATKEAVQEGYVFLADLAQRGYTTWGRSTDVLDFPKGNVSLAYGFGPRDPKQHSFPLGTTFQPIGRQQANILVTEGLLMSGTTKHPDEAWRVLQFLTGPKANEIHASAKYALRNLPSTKAGLLAISKVVPGTRHVMDSMQYARLPRLARTEVWERVIGDLQKELGDLFDQKKSVQVATEGMQRALISQLGR